jgi:hypothetical protein
VLLCVGDPRLGDEDGEREHVARGIQTGAVIGSDCGCDLSSPVISTLASSVLPLAASATTRP